MNFDTQAARARAALARAGIQPMALDDTRGCAGKRTTNMGPLLSLCTECPRRARLTGVRMPPPVEWLDGDYVCAMRFWPPHAPTVDDAAAPAQPHAVGGCA